MERLQDVIEAANAFIGQATILNSNPEFQDAYRAYVNSIDFRDRFGCSQSELTDLQVDMLVLTDAFFEVDDEGRLSVEHAHCHSASTWIDGEWKNV